MAENTKKLKIKIMYRGYKVDISLDSEDLYQKGLAVTKIHKANIYGGLRRHLSPNGSIDGSELEKTWFPEIEADVFISHSHKDERLAVTFAGWLSENFNIDAFVDSGIWGYANNLIKNIDLEFCTENKGVTFDYDKRNFSTAHVHMMLGMALTKMMNKTECLFFLNTPNSLSPSKIIGESETSSPWLYYEIGLAGMIQKPLFKHKRRKHLYKGKSFSDLLESEKNLTIKYKVAMEHLVEVTGPDLGNWRKQYTSALPKPTYPLDTLYELY